MESSSRRPAFSFRIEGADAQPDNAVPAAVLVQILQSAQQAFGLIGVHVEGRSIRERARIRARQPVLLGVFLDESKQLLCVEEEAIGVSAFSSTREGLIRELECQLGMLWTEYASAPDDELDGRAREMKRALLSRFSEGSDAS